MGIFKSIKSLFLDEKSPEEKKESNIDKTKSHDEDMESKIKSK